MKSTSSFFGSYTSGGTWNPGEKELDVPWKIGIWPGLGPWMEPSKLGSEIIIIKLYK